MTNHRLFRSAALALALAGAVSGARADGPLAVSASGGVATVGSAAGLTLTLDLAASFPLLGVTFAFDWDGAALSFDRAGSAVFGLPWVSFVALGEPADTVETITASSYGLSAVLTQILDLPAGQPTLQLSFIGLAAGSHPVTYTLDLVDDQVAQFTGTGAAPVTISAVPEPQPALLLLSGIAALGWMSRRRAA